MASNPFDQFDATGGTGPLVGPAPKAPAPPSETELRRLQLAEEANKRAEEAHIAKMTGKGADGSPTGTTLVPAALATKAQSDVGIYATMANATDTFQDDYGGNWLGGLENTAQAYSPVPVGTPGQSEWWGAFKATDNQIRNDLFGSALTSTEKAAYSATTIEPGMNPAKIRGNLERRTQIIREALSRQREFMLANGYRPEAVDALFSPILQQQEQLAATAGGATQAEEVPALTGGAFQNADGQIAGNTHNNGDSAAGGQIATGETRREDNPILAGIRDEYAQRLARGDSASSIIAWAREAGVDASAAPSIARQVAYRDKNPGVAIGEYNTTQLDDRIVAVSPAQQFAADTADSTLGAFAISAGDAATGFNLDSIIGATGGNAEQARLGMGEVSDRNYPASLAGTIFGGTLAAMGGEAAMGGLIARNVPRALAADSAYGAVAGAGMTDYAQDGTPATIADRAGGAITGTLAGLAGSGLGQLAGRGMQSFARGVSDPAVSAMQSAGVPMTLGQMVGNSGKAGAMVKTAEDRIAGLPIAGDMINARRTEGVRSVNVKAFDKALEPVGGTIGDLIGSEAVDEAHQQVQNAFASALAGKAAAADAKFGTDLLAASTQTLAIPRVGQEVGDSIQEILAPYMQGGQLSGDAMQAISQELRTLKAGYRTQEPALFNRIGKAIDATEESIFGMFRRQTPEVMPAYDAAKKAYRRVSILADAVNAADNQAEQMFTPAQLNRADKANAKKYEGSISAAAGPRQFRDLSRPAQAVLPNQIPDSGTAGRVVLPLVGAGIIGGDAATGDGLSATGLTLGAIVAGAYTKAGQRVLTKPARGMKPGTTRRAILENDRTKRLLGAGAAAGSAAGLTSQP